MDIVEKKLKALEIILKNYKLTLCNQLNSEGEIRKAMFFPVYEHKVKFLTQEEFEILKEVMKNEE